MIDAPILSLTDVAALMRCAETTVEQKARAGEIPGLLWGDGGWVFPAAALYEHLNRLARENAAGRRTPSTVSAVAARAPARRTPPALPSIANN